jgi:hypothetical protein
MNKTYNFRLLLDDLLDQIGIDDLEVASVYNRLVVDVHSDSVLERLTTIVGLSLHQLSELIAI